MTQPKVGTDARTSERLATILDLRAPVRAGGPREAPGRYAEVPAYRPAPGYFDGDHDRFAACLRDELTPVGVLEELLAARLVSAAWRLNQTMLAATTGDGPGSAIIEELDRALALAVATFERARTARRGRWGQSAPSETVAVAAPTGHRDIPDDEPVSLAEDMGWSRRFDPVAAVDLDAHAPASDGDDEATDPSRLWRDRLVFDPGVSDRSPVVRGTWITVGQVVSRVVDGWSWADILRAHPELCEADIRACLAYSVEEEGSGSLAC